ncbi:helix-turn-helix domain-containing protein [Streptomyces griseoluteus]|uniref:helix-turn-helix domain-containing protein n=1 Tax=Streptomyces griseoluteus TaxID=29306 RepID=UPI003813AD8D
MPWAAGPGGVAAEQMKCPGTPVSYGCGVGPGPSSICRMSFAPAISRPRNRGCRRLGRRADGARSRQLVPRHLDLDTLREGVAGLGTGVRVALGSQAPGIDGFRGSLREALRAKAVAQTGRNDSLRVVAFETSRSPRCSRRSQRATTKQAATRLHLHKHTVHYRIRKAEELLGRPLAEDRLDVEMALLPRTPLWRHR